MKQKKFEILDRNQVLSGLLNIMAVANTDKQVVGYEYWLTHSGYALGDAQERQGGDGGIFGLLFLYIEF